MKKKISIRQLEVGMYIHDLDTAWMDHPFLKNRFLVKDGNIVPKLLKSGIKHVVIDTDKGLDLDAAPTIEEVDLKLHQETEKIAESSTPIESEIPLSEEINTAKSIYSDAKNVIHNLMRDVRLGKLVEFDHIEHTSEKIIDSIFRNKDALVSLTRVKNKDEYTFMHCVSVSGLMTTFSRAMGWDRAKIKEVAIGGLLHDIGKAMVPLEILNKPGKLTEKEFQIMKTHVDYSLELLTANTSLSQASLDVANQHHERIDGTGYPLGLKGEQISTVGQMSAIVDVYDALTSIRVYKQAWEPSSTLKKLLEWTPDHFDPGLVQHFIRCLGIFPVGTLVELESGLVGIVTEQSETNLLRPILRIIYDAKERAYTAVRILDLSKRPKQKIKSSISTAKYEIDLDAFL